MTQPVASTPAPHGHHYERLGECLAGLGSEGAGLYLDFRKIPYGIYPTFFGFILLHECLYAPGPPPGGFVPSVGGHRNGSPARHFTPPATGGGVGEGAGGGVTSSPPPGNICGNPEGCVG
ncbi:MAG TPA: hypothetical protein VHW06_21535 [Streptosporangiaceae bacterium]|nr:hypothetical protein [Streptosporangiaceae bacterium]